MDVEDPDKPAPTNDEAAPLEPEADQATNDAVAQHEFDHAVKTAFTKP